MPNRHDSLAPGFLIASPPLGDPNFDRTVVLLAMHGADGALGFVINRVAPMDLGELLKLAGYEVRRSHPQAVYLGGPVQTSSGWVLGEGLEGEDAIAVGERLRVSSSRAAFDALHARVDGPGSEDAGPPRRLVLLGYSGWAPGQLESEIAGGAWLPVPLDDAVLFDVAPEERWERAFALLGLTPATGMSMRIVGDA